MQCMMHPPLTLDFFMLCACRHAHQISLMPSLSLLSRFVHTAVVAGNNEALCGALELEARSGIEPLYAALQAAA